MGADTEADIYLNVFGERGDWGKRYLRQSNNKTKYRTGQVRIRHNLRHVVRSPVFGVSTNRAVQPQKVARGWNFWI